MGRFTWESMTTMHFIWYNIMTNYFTIALSSIDMTCMLTYSSLIIIIIG